MQIVACISQLENSCRRADRQQRGLTTLEMAKSPCRDDLRRNSRLGRYLSIASSVCWIADGGTRNRPE
jgi:hypothetical protein